MSVTFPNETQDYRSARAALLQREVRCDGKWRPSPLN